jgi:hypothetical protein
VLAFYADESGTFSLRPAGQPWVVLLAVGLNDDHWMTIEEAMNGLKRRYFPDRAPREIEIRSHHLRMAHAYPRSENPFSRLSGETLRRFGEELYALIDVLPFEWRAAVMHKPSIAARLAIRPGAQLFTIAYLDLLRSLDRWCRSAGQPGRLFIDQRDAQLHGGVHDAIVRAHDLVRISDRPAFEHVIERPYFHDSAASNHIQLADVVAYNVLRRFRDDRPDYPYYRRIIAKQAVFE